MFLQILLKEQNHLLLMKHPKTQNSTLVLSWMRLMKTLKRKVLNNLKVVKNEQWTNKE